MVHDDDEELTAEDRRTHPPGVALGGDRHSGVEDLRNGSANGNPMPADSTARGEHRWPLARPWRSRDRAPARSRASPHTLRQSDAEFDLKPGFSALAFIECSSIPQSLVTLVTNNPKDYRHLDKVQLVSVTAG
jgi:hypothetical protein